MTLEMAKNRRVAALNNRSEDRLLVKPGHASQIKFPKDGTVAAYLLDALSRGCGTEQLETETGWSKSLVLGNLYKVAKKTGVGIRRRADVLHLVLPDGAEEIYPTARTVATETTSGRGGDFTIIDVTPA